MCGNRRNGGWTLLETFIVLGIFGCLFLMLMPALQASRESARQTNCVQNLKNIGIATHNYGQANRVLPASASLVHDRAGKITAIGEPSLFTAIFPYAAGAKKREVAPNSQPSWLLCPSYDGSPWADPATRHEAITNYRPLGATHIESLSVASPNPMKPKYEQSKQSPHPDGACFPASYRTFGSIPNGLSNTFFLTESVEPRFSRWRVGAESAVVGLPRDVEFEKNEFWFCLPKGYDEAKKGNENSVYWAYHTYLDWDYDRNPYDGADGTQGGKCGPGSNHPNGVPHLYCDGSARMIPRSIDIPLYITLIPFPIQSCAVRHGMEPVFPEGKQAVERKFGLESVLFAFVGPITNALSVVN